MFTDVEGFGLLWIMRAVEDAQVREHANAVVEELDLDPRLAEFIPMRPNRGKHRRAYDRLLSSLGEVSRTPEPQRTHAIEQLRELVAAKRG